MREAWTADFQARAAAYWTAERTHGQFGPKQLILPPSEYGPLLRSMNLLKTDASMSPECVRKYMQISHMLALLEPQLQDLAAAHSEVRVLDLACGNSYLTLTMAMSFKRRIRHPARILGVDRNERLIEACRERAWRLELEELLRFEGSNIDLFDLDRAWQRAFGQAAQEPKAHLLVALHACDTATDDALALGLGMGVPAMAVVPCCQAELAKQWAAMASCEETCAFTPIWSWPHLRREVAANMTNALRALLLRGCGFQVMAIEFVPSSHTPKNTMLRAIKRGDGSSEAFGEYVRLRHGLGGPRIALERLLPPVHQEQLRHAEAEYPGAAGP